MEIKISINDETVTLNHITTIHAATKIPINNDSSHCKECIKFYTSESDIPVAKVVNGDGVKISISETDILK